MLNVLKLYKSSEICNIAFFFQKAHIPQSIMDVIQGKVPCDMHDEFDIVSKDACI